MENVIIGVMAVGLAVAVIAFVIAEIKKNGKMKELEKAINAKRDFLVRMSHDMRTPMNGIMGLVELSDDEEDITVLKRYIRKMGESCEYLLDIVKDTLEMNETESKNIPLNYETVNSGEFMQAIYEMLAPTLANKNQKFTWNNINMDLNSDVLIDKNRLKQVIVNIVSNASKFTPEGGSITIDTECTLRENNMSHCVFSIKDNGVGMSDKFIKEGLFKAFSQEHNALSSQYSGSGLGLAIANNLIKLMGGKINVKSEMGKGSEFVIEIDIEVTGYTSENKSSHLEAAFKYELEGKRILLVEDHMLNLEIAEKLLEKQGMIVDVAVNGAEAVDYFMASPDNFYDAILMDIRMPVMDGNEATKLIRKMEREDALTVPIIAMTANAFEEDIQLSKRAGMNAHISKPVNVRDLYYNLDVLINKRKIRA